MTQVCHLMCDDYYIYFFQKSHQVSLSLLEEELTSLMDHGAEQKESKQVLYKDDVECILMMYLGLVRSDTTETQGMGREYECSSVGFCMFSCDTRSVFDVLCFRM